MHLVEFNNSCVKRIFTLLLFFFLSANSWGKSYFISPSGSDFNNGSLANPYLTLTYALTKIAAGDTIFVMQGTYSVSSPINITLTGNPDMKTVLINYSAERPLFDFSSMPFSSTNRGFQLKGSYWHIKGIEIKGAGDNGMNISGSNNIVEYCSFLENRDTGLQLGGGASNNSIINCDSYYNSDPTEKNADGFAPKLDVGTGNYFYGCRAWQNSDDGWDGYLRGSDNKSTTIENCWSFKNGYLKTGLESQGNGNGFKMGGSDDKLLMHNCILKNCVAFDNRVKGFDQNNNKGSMILYNCTGYRNSINYSLNSEIDPLKTAEIKNCVSFESTNSIAVFVQQITNSWMFGNPIVNNDFVSLDPSEATGQRNADGSLPNISFLHIAAGSKLIDVGTDVGITYKGLAPDLGAFEFDSPVAIDKSVVPISFRLEQNYPNPFNPSTTIRYSVVETPYMASQGQRVTLKIYDVLGRVVSMLVDEIKPAGNYTIQFNAGNLPTGVYFCAMKSGASLAVKKMIYMK